MLSATLGPEVESWCKLNFDNIVRIRVGAANSATETIDQKLVYCGSEAGKLLAFRNIVKAGIQPPVLVFVQTKERASELFKAELQRRSSKILEERVYCRLETCIDRPLH